MPQISLEEIVNDLDLAESFTIQRSTGSFVLGGFSTVVTNVQGYGIVTVAKDQDLEMIPEGDRVTGAMLLHSATKIYITTLGAPTYGSDQYNPGDYGGNQHVSDIIIWHEQQYRVLSIAPWSNFGYWRAVMVRMAGQ